MKTYCKTWQDYQNEKVSITLSNNAVSRIRQLLEKSTSNIPVISALIPQPLTDTIKLPSQDNEHAVTLTNSGKWQIEKLLDTHRLASSSIGYCYIQSNSSSTPSQSSSTAGSQKRKAEHLPEGDPTHVGQLEKPEDAWLAKTRNVLVVGKWKSARLPEYKKVSSISLLRCTRPISN